jgi:uncharacterized membrane-anchored protein
MEFENLPVKNYTFDSYYIETMGITTLLFQTGYLTIKEMKYYEKYLNKGKEIVLMGIGFDPEKRNIGNYLLESLL